MKNLFAVGENKNGFFVYPVILPPDEDFVSGSEVSEYQVAHNLCCQLNRAAIAYANYYITAFVLEPTAAIQTIKRHFNAEEIYQIVDKLKVIPNAAGQ
jgi:hypothetical protein